MFVKEHAQKWPVQVVCQVLQLSRSAYYNWLSGTSSSNKQMENPVHKAIKKPFNSTGGGMESDAW